MITVKSIEYLLLSPITIEYSSTRALQFLSKRATMTATTKNAMRLLERDLSGTYYIHTYIEPMSI